MDFNEDLKSSNKPKSVENVLNFLKTFNHSLNKLNSDFKNEHLNKIKKIYEYKVIAYFYIIFFIFLTNEEASAKLI